MIQTQMIGDRIRTYSDAGMKIRQDQTGIIYYDAVDVPSMGYTYTETDIPIPKEDINESSNYAENVLNIIMGGDIE